MKQCLKKSTFNLKKGIKITLWASKFNVRNGNAKNIFKALFLHLKIFCCKRGAINGVSDDHCSSMQ
jgi:hypothetical protein